MIVIYEPLCKDFSHEKINSGFIFSFHKAFPNKEIHYYAHRTQIDSIKKIIVTDNLLIKNLVFHNLHISNKISIYSFIIQLTNLIKITNTLKINKENRLFLTSHNILILFIIKFFNYFNKFKFYLVLHGSFEDINNGVLNYKINQILKFNSLPKKSLYSKFKNISPNKIAALFKRYAQFNRFSFFRFLFTFFFNTKNLLEWKLNKKNITYIAISEHILKNAKLFLDLDKINIKYHFYPNYFSNKIYKPLNKSIKFAVFGYGDPIVLYNIAKNLQNAVVNDPNFEIRIIGMDNTITEYFNFITNPSKGSTLTRTEMESLVDDIDVFLILYSNQKYRLSCSATILEALSYNKPIIHFKNDCISQFNTEFCKIGYEVNSLDEFSDVMLNCINNYEKAKIDFKYFSQNINILKNKYSIDYNFKNLVDLYK